MYRKNITRYYVKRLRQTLIIGMIGSIIGACSWFSDPEEIRFSALRNFEQGNEAYNRMDYHDAIMNYRKAIELDEMTPEFHYNLGLAFHSIERYEEALQSYKKAAELNPKMAETYYNAALIHHKLYNAEKAHQNFNKYQQLIGMQRKPIMEKEKDEKNKTPMQDISMKGASKKKLLTKSDSKKMAKIKTKQGQ